jgi:CRP/FNR family transcriptional regulator
MNREVPSPRCSTCSVRAGGPFHRLDPEDLERVSREKAVHRYEAGQVLFYEGTPRVSGLCLHSGRAKVYKSTAGDHVHILGIAQPGDILGLGALLSGDLHSTTAEMIEPGLACHLDKETLLGLVQDRPEVARAFLTILAGQVRASHEERAELATGDVRERLARLLVRLAREYGEPDESDEESIVIHLHLSRQEIAEMAGTAAETAIRHLTVFRHDGLIADRGRHLVILDLPHLSRIARLP